MEEGRFYSDSEIIKYSLSASAGKLSLAYEVRLAQLCELAKKIYDESAAVSGKSDIMEAVCGCEEIKSIYDKYCLIFGDKLGFIAESAEEDRYLSRGLSLSDSLYVCRQLARSGGRIYTAVDVPAWFSDSEQTKTGGEIKMVFIRGKQSNAAFETFAKNIFGVMPSGAESFGDVCETVFSGEADYGIIPVENSSDGRLGSFYKLIEKYGLAIVLSCYVGGADGESYTKFALCSRNIKYVKASGDCVFHFRLTLDRLSELSRVLSSSDFFGASVKRADLLPFSVAGRENSLDLIFSVGNADIAGFITFLKLEYPQFLPIGIYTETGDGRNGE